MFCSNCGTQNVDAAKFCKKCGTKLIGGVDTPAQASAQSVPSTAARNTVPVQQVQTSPKRNASYKKYVFAAVIAIVLMAVLLVLGGKDTIYLNDYLTIEVSGYDGYGAVSASIDWDAIEVEYGDDLISANGQTAMASQSMGVSVPIEFLKYSVSVGLTPSSALSNGDTVAYSWVIDETVFEYINCELDYESGSYTVQSLAKAEQFDAFANIAIVVSGFDGQAHAKMESVGEGLSLRYFQYDAMEDLSNGDTVTVSIDEAYVAQIAEETGKIPQTLSKEYPVSGLLSYIDTVDQLSAQGLQSLQTKAQEVYETMVMCEWGEESTVASFEYMGNYLLTPKDDGAYYNNILFLVYKPTIQTDFHYEGQSFYSLDDTYWCVYFCDVAVDGEGNVSMDDISRWYYSGGSIELSSDIRVKTFRVTHTKKWEYTGYAEYQDLDDFVYEESTASYNEYNVADNVPR